MKNFEVEYEALRNAVVTSIVKRCNDILDANCGVEMETSVPFRAGDGEQMVEYNLTGVELINLVSVYLRGSSGVTGNTISIEVHHLGIGDLIVINDFLSAYEPDEIYMIGAEELAYFHHQ